MPKDGFTSITVSIRVYDDWSEFFKRRKFNLSKKGITSLSGLVTCILYNVLQQNGPTLTDIVMTEEDSNAE